MSERATRRQHTNKPAKHKSKHIPKKSPHKKVATFLDLSLKHYGIDTDDEAWQTHNIHMCVMSFYIYHDEYIFTDNQRIEYC